MDEKSLDQLLRRRGDTAQSSLPANFQQNVWREIRQRRTARTNGFAAFTGWQWLLRPQFVTACLVVAMGVGVGVGSRQRERVAVSTTQALNLDVFGAAAPTLPSTLLSSHL